MLGNAFAPTLRAAQAGDERAFARLWRDANPLMVRYLRVIGVEDPYDSACEGWVSVVRGLRGFDGDETDWRVWVCTCARMCAEESSLRSSWSPFRTRSAVLEAEPDELDLEELLEPGTADDPRHRGVNATIRALQALPMGQGEVVDLRLGWGLPSKDVASLVGLDSSKVLKAEARALERLDTRADLVQWSLNAPPTAAELADERVATAAFRAAPKASKRPVGEARIIALGSGGRPGVGLRAAGRSRVAVLGIAALSASVMSLGGLSAAAYVGVLPAPVQSFAHEVVGAPLPATPTVRATPKGATTHRAVPTVAVGPDATAGSSAAPGLCRAWAVDKAKGTARASSVAFRNLSKAAGGDAAVEGYCATALSTAPGGGPKDAPTAKTNSPNPNSTKQPGKPTTTSNPGRAPSVPPGQADPKPTASKAPPATPPKSGPRSTSSASEVAPTAPAADPPGQGKGRRG